jgi:hypothetical protein
MVTSALVVAGSPTDHVVGPTADSRPIAGYPAIPPVGVVVAAEPQDLLFGNIRQEVTRPSGTKTSQALKS